MSKIHAHMTTISQRSIASRVRRRHTCTSVTTAAIHTMATTTTMIGV